MIFISHSSKDKAAALDVQQRLLGFGYDTSQLFLDSDAQVGISAGSKWEQVLYSRLKDCRALIVLCSANWQESKWCFAELVYAKAMGKEIFPVLLQECSISQVVAEHQAVYVYKEGEAAYARLWKVLDSRHLGPRDDFGWPPKDGDLCPFPGLPAFDERFAGVYFGREAETQTILEDLRKMRENGEPRLLMIIGGSGSGKSSLLKAGVLPRLKHKTVDTEWVILPTLRYGEQANEQRTIFDQLAVNVVELFPKDSKSMPDWKLLRSQFIGDDVKLAIKALVEILQDLTLARDRPDATVLIVIDQFEELLTPFAGPMAAKSLRFLRELLSCRNGQLLVIGTMRSDHLDIYEQSSYALRAPYFKPWRLGPFPPERIEEVIREPVKRSDVEITDELLERLKRDTPTAEALPLLAFTLERLYRGYASHGKLELQDYVSLGGMEGSIQTCIERIVLPNSLPANEADALRLTFVKHLAQANDKGEVVRLTARWDDLPATAKPILDKFVNERLLIRSKNKDEGKSEQPWVSIEVAHEAMFRCWNDLKEWLRTSADILRWRRDVRRDQANDPNWTGLRPAQLAVARDWPIRRRNELTADEVDWINTGILWDRIRRCIVGSVVLVVALLAGIAWWQKNNADNETREAQRALTASFFRTIGVSNQDLIDDLPRDERESLWELAQLDRVNAAVRKNLLKRWFGTTEAFKRGDARGGQGFQAVTGLNWEYHQLAISDAAEFGRRLAAALDNPQETDYDHLSSFSSALAALAAKMEPQAAAEIAKGLATALENPQGTDFNRVLNLGSVLAALVAKMEPQAAAKIAIGLAAALENPQETNSNRIWNLSRALAALTARVEPQAAAEIAKGFAAALENPQETDFNRVLNLGSVLAALVAKMEPQAAAKIAKGLAVALGNPQETNSNRLSSLGSTLAELVAKMEPQAAAEIARKGAQRLAAALENPQETEFDYSLSSLGGALAELAAKMEPQAAAEIARKGAQRLAAALENPQETDSYPLSSRFSSLGSALAALVAKLEPQAAAKIAMRAVHRLVTALENPQEADSSHLLRLRDVLVALTADMEPQAAAEIAKDLAAALENPQMTNSDRRSDLSRVLAALAARVEPQAAAEIAKGLATALENPRETDSYPLSSLGNALAALAARVELQAAAEIAKGLMTALENPQTNSNRLSSLGNALAALAAKMESQAAAEIARRGAQRLATALENPQVTDDNDSLSSLGSALAALAAKMEPQAAAEIARRGAQRLATALENPQVTYYDTLLNLGRVLRVLAAKMEPQAAAEIAEGLAAALENPQLTGSSRFWSLGNALAALAAKMKPQAAAEIAKGLTATLKNAQETDSDRLSSLGIALAALCALLPSAHHTNLLALSNLLLRPVSKSEREDDGEEQPYDRKLVKAVCAQLGPQDLVEVLKYPFSTGVAEQIVVNQLEAKTGRDFAGNVWKFAEQAAALGIKNIASPVHRPSVQDALSELDKL
jgi:general stress protein YciG